MLIYKKAIYGQYSYTENLSLKWLNGAVVVGFLCLGLWLTFLIISLPSTDALYYCVSWIPWVIFVYNTFKQEILPTYIINEKEEYEALEIVSASKYSPNIEDLEVESKIRTKKIYLNSKLTLSELAKAIGTNRTYLSIYLNQELGTTFYDFINSFRLEDAEKLLNSDLSRKYTLETITNECGFNSVSTFRRAFQ